MGERHSPSPSVRIRFSVFVEDSKESAAAAAAANFGGLVLCCMDSYDSEKIRIFSIFVLSAQTKSPVEKEKRKASFEIYKICILLHRSKYLQSFAPILSHSGYDCYK